MSFGKEMLGRRHVLPSVVSSLAELQVEGTFTTGTYLVTVHHPICSDDGDLNKALYGSFLPLPSQDLFPLPQADVYDVEKQPGSIICVKNKRITLNEGRKRVQLRVVSKGDRPIQVRVRYCEASRRLILFRLDHIIILSRQILNSSSIEHKHMASGSTSQLGHLCVLSLEMQRQSLLCRSLASRLSRAVMD